MSEGRNPSVGRGPIDISDDAELAALVGLAGLPNQTPRRLWSLVELDRPTKVWHRIATGALLRNGRADDAAREWATWAALVDPGTELARHRRAGVAVSPYGHLGYPDALLDDPEPPALVFRKGGAPLDDRVRVAIVGTRRCSRYGRQVANQLGARLARRGVDVVSGLATGIDAAAHAGAIHAEPRRTVAVVAGGVDVVYPVSNRGLYERIGASGALLSEWPLGARPSPWRFPARNRLVAALSAAVVVVESPVKGGSMYTVDEALARNRAVFAVPGSIHSPVSSGTNKLIADGAHVLHDIDELLQVLALDTPASAADRVSTSAPTLGIESWLLEAIGWEPVELDAVVGESGRSPGEVTLEVERLINDGAVRRVGATIERVVR